MELSPTDLLLAAEDAVVGLQQITDEESDIIASALSHDRSLWYSWRNIGNGAAKKRETKEKKDEKKYDCYKSRRPILFAV